MRAEYDFPGLDPVGLGPERRRVPLVIPDDLRLLLLEPIQVTGRLVAGPVNRIALVDGPNRDLVIVVSGDVLGRADRISQRNLECCYRRVVPRPGDGGGGRAGLPRQPIVNGGDCGRQHNQ